MNFLQRIGQRLKRPEHSGYGGSGGMGFLNWLSRGGFDYRAEAGPLHESSIPLTCLKWEQRASIEAEAVAQKRTESGKWENNPTAPILELLANPNPHFDIYQLLDAVRFDYHLDGNAYLYKVRSGSRKVVQLWWIPSAMIDPRWEEDGADFISCYEYRVNGKVYAIPVEDIIHIKNGIDPDWQGRKGLSDFKAVLREVCSDNEAATFSAALLRNMGVPGVIIAPKGGGNDEAEMTKAERRRFVEEWQERFTGERRGEPFVQGMPVEITVPGFTPQQLVLDKIRKIPEERISAAFGIPAVVLGLGAGLEASTAKASHADAREQAYESCIIPTLYTIARALTKQLMSEFDDVKNARIWFDLSEVRVLQQDANELFKRLSLAFEKGWLKRSEVREAAGYKSTPEDEIYFKKDEPKAPNDEENDGDPLDDDSDATTAEETEDIEKELKTARRFMAAAWRRTVKADV